MGPEIYASDGTAAGTVRITDFGFFNPFGWEGEFQEGGLLSSQIARLGSRLIFWATDGLHQYQPWSSLGTPESTAPLCSGCAFSPSALFQPLNGRLVFLATVNDSFELWASDGIPAGYPGCSQKTAPNAGTSLPLRRGRVLPRTRSQRSQLDPLDQRRHAAGRHPTVRRSGACGLGFRPLCATLGGQDPFRRLGRKMPTNSTNSNVELWSSDGSPDGMRQVADINRAGNSSNVANLVASGNDAFFIASATPLTTAAEA